MAETFYKQISANKRNSFLLTLVIVIPFALLGFAIGYAIGGDLASAFFVMIVALGVGAQCAASYFKGDSLVLAVSGARQVDQASAPQLMNVIQEAGDRGEHTDAEGLRHRRHGAQRFRDRPRSQARLRRHHDRPPRSSTARSSRA